MYKSCCRSSYILIGSNYYWYERNGLVVSFVIDDLGFRLVVIFFWFLIFMYIFIVKEVG